jgi:hypothetical protein
MIQASRNATASSAGKEKFLPDDISATWDHPFSAETNRSVA